MDSLSALPLLLKAAILGTVEGLTEFLPISSTGHLILTASLLGFTGEKAKLFEVAIQTGAMLSVIWYFRVRIARVVMGLFNSEPARRFAINVVIAFLPAAVLGVVFGSMIKRVLFKPIPVALAFIVGALVILWVERREAQLQQPARVDNVDDLSRLDALKLGLAQAFALIPGTSRSGATIIGGMLFGLSRKAATEFSFFLAIPTLVGAGVYDTYKYRDLISWADAPLFGVGIATAFVSALVCVHWLIWFVSTHNFVPFAWYRIGFGILVLVTAALNVLDWTA
ncbi:MAG TPA: undecaprenyl-diphosphate phosphatase [Polyangiales bacterium]|nr:undecaprenyl-diphosphate phosphatase [Polyangiales bacterium]